jgi:hypothetical protein
VVAHARGWREGVLLPETITAALYDPANKIVIHRNDPFNRGLSYVDIACLALPGVEAICRHGGGGKVVRGALTADARAELRDSTVEERHSKLARIACGIGYRLYSVLEDAVRLRKVPAHQAEEVHQHLIGLYLRDAGILDYSLGDGGLRKRKDPSRRQLRLR